ncbi:UNVERIFIED_CONTAM: hypothetical protein FKN15_020556 [Acipenser sinensis]
MDRNALAELLQALESRRDAEERRREERYTALIERTAKNTSGAVALGEHEPDHLFTYCPRILCIHSPQSRLHAPKTGDRALFPFCSGL